ncbi:hypothetical protein GCM10025858_37310 [Alicyclobacillus sacchari]|nr:hypothetical protein GCM10025858_37310 [Alicyclobacillus sacchari]
MTYTATAPTIVAVPSQIKDKPDTAKKLAPILGMSEASVLRQISQRELMVYIRPGGRQMPEAKANQIRALGLPGIYLTEDGKRAYPYGDLAAQVLGITTMRTSV